MSLSTLAFASGGLGVFLFLLGAGRAFVRYHLDLWARGRGLRLVDFAGARLLEVPWAWAASPSSLRIVVEDGERRRHAGSITFGSWLSFAAGRVEVTWDDSTGAHP